MHTSHLVNARRKTGRDAKRNEGRIESSFGSLRPFSFQRVASLSLDCCAPELPFGEFANEIRGVIKRSDRSARRYIRGTRERITYVWEKTGGFGAAQKRLRRPIIISRGDAPF